MPRLRIPLLCLAALVSIAPALRADEAKPDPAQVEFFEKQVRPVLADNCFSCHGPDKQRGSLRLDSRKAILTGGESGPAMVPGEPEKSRLTRMIRGLGDPDQRTPQMMPPKGKLSDEKINALVAWVKMGAPWPEAVADVRPADPKSTFKITDKDRAFWSFQPVKEVPAPAVKDRAWARKPLDNFILAKLEEKGLKPVAAADPRALIRRLHFDLLGLPPTQDEVESFVKEYGAKPQAAVEALVDRLLASPHYGERWARHWLDVARYGEDQAHTFESRKYPDGFRYRDWVVKAFNSDMPYDRFVMEQIAGDLLDGTDRPGRLAAVGYFSLGPVYYGRATADEVDDRIDTLARGFLGLTVSCARCHDHKFDPLSMNDYYALAGVFGSTDYKEYALTPQGEIDDNYKPEPVDPKDKNKKPTGPRRPVVHSLTEKANPSNMRVHLRGNPANLGDEAPRRFLAILTEGDPRPFAKGSGRLELATAIASKDNPLTARVIVNRVWMHHFGRGLVGTPSNFGSLGERPTHPELLDHLAARFMADGWSIKKLHREILLSSTYQLATKHDEKNAKVDADNRLLWRANRRRLEVEPWRDAMLAVAGNLDRTLGGPSGDLSAPDYRRRTLYGAVSRHNLDPVLRLFDFPDPNLTSDQRPVTSVPLQQLFVLNSEFMVRQAKALAARLTADTKGDDASRIRRAYQLVYGRPATEREEQVALRFLTTAPANPQGLSAWERYAQALLSANEFAFVD